jgi:hypothetical protein
MSISTDESNRRAHMEQRQQAIASRSRASSPAPGPRGSGHRRDRSVGGGAATRFPIQTSPTQTKDRQTARHSLEVPGSTDAAANPPAADKHVDSSTNGTADGDAPVDLSSMDGGGGGAALTGGALEKRQSADRVPGSRFPRGHSTLDSISNIKSEHFEKGGERPRGISLSDKPMDD